TIILEHGKIRFWAEHLDRILEACSVLHLGISGNSDFFTSWPHLLVQLAEKNNCTALTRIKLKVWRSGTGLYTPETDAIDWLATASPTQLPSEDALEIVICESAGTIPSIFSSFKGINAPVYVLASREKAVKKVGDVLLLDPKKN